MDLAGAPQNAGGHPSRRLDCAGQPARRSLQVAAGWPGNGIPSPIDLSDIDYRGVTCSPLLAFFSLTYAKGATVARMIRHDLH